MNFKSILAIIFVIIVFFALFSSCFNDGHAPGYGNTSKCTICGKSATHTTSNYGFCDKHWEKAIGN